MIVDDGVDYSEPDVVKITVTAPDAWADSSLENEDPDKWKFKTIQSAIDAVYDGTNGEKAIAIENGLYREKITVQPGIQLFGMASQDSVVPRAHIIGDADVVDAVTLRDNTRIQNLRIKCQKSSRAATERAAIKVIGNNVTVSKCFIVCSKSNGIKLEGNASADIIKSVIDRVHGDGIKSEGPVFTVRDCKLSNIGVSAVWAKDCKSIRIENCVIYRTGWHGLGFDRCEDVIVDHCTIIDFGWEAKNYPEEHQNGIMITPGSSIGVTNNLMEINHRRSLIGVNSDSDLTYSYNYIYSKQEIPGYYRNNLSIETVDSTNYPNSLQTTTNDPLIVGPDMGDFTLDHESPACGLGKNGTNPGARDATYIGVECTPTSPIQVSPEKGSEVDPNKVVLEWEASTDSHGESASIEYCVLINEDSTPDICVYDGCKDQEPTNDTFLSLTKTGVKFQCGKAYFWSVVAKDEYGNFSEIKDKDWWNFIILSGQTDADDSQENSS